MAYKLDMKAPHRLQDLRSPPGKGISINQFITLTIAEKMAALDTKNYLQERAKCGNREKLLAVLAKAPDIEPEEADHLPQ